MNAAFRRKLLRLRINQVTVPPVSIDFPEEIEPIPGKRVYLIDVPPGLEEIRVGSKLRARVGDQCLELHGNEARTFLERRRNYDWSAQASTFRLSDADGEALASARAHYEENRGRVVGSGRALVRHLGLLSNDEENPVLNNAGALLLCEMEPADWKLDLQIAVAEGVASTARVRKKAPLLPAFDDVWSAVEEAFPAADQVVGVQRRSVRTIPERALREALINAIAHRDYAQPRGSIVAIAAGQPTETLRVSSPGGFPAGVLADRLLTTRSRPRNPVLADALHTLGLAESEGVGIDTMYRLMLRDGHPAPDIQEAGGDVTCRLTGGRLDHDVRRFFGDLEAAEKSLGSDVKTYIAITLLMSATPLRPETLAREAQCGEQEAFELLLNLAKRGVLRRMLNRSRSFVLSEQARESLKRRIAYSTPKKSEQQWTIVRAYLDDSGEISSADASELLGVKPERAAAILSKLYRERGVIEPVGAARGRGVRYRLS